MGAVESETGLAAEPVGPTVLRSSSQRLGSSASAGRGGQRIALVVFGNLMPPLAAFVASPLLAQTLGAAGRGTVSAATAPLTLMIGAATLGLPESVTYFVASGAGRSRRVLRRAVVWIAVAGLAASLLIWSLAGYLAAGDHRLSTLIVLASAAIAPSLVVAVMRGFAAGRGRWGLVTADRILQSVGRLGALLVLLWAGDLTILSGTVVIAASSLAGAVAYLPLLLRHGHQPGRDQGPEPAVLSYGMRNWSGSLSGVLVSRLDQALMVPLSSPFQLGLYAVSVGISELPLVFNSAVRDVTFASESGRPDAERLAVAARLSTAVTAVSAVGVGLLSAVFMVPLFGPDFRSAVPVTLVLLVAVVGGNPGSVAGIGLSARGRPGLRSLSLTLALGLDLVLLLLLVPPLGAMGAALATLGANCSTAALNLVWLRRFYGLPIRDFLGLRRADLAIVAAAGRSIAARARRTPAAVAQSR